MARIQLSESYRIISPLKTVLMSTGSDLCVLAFILTSFHMFHRFLQMHNTRNKTRKTQIRSESKKRNLSMKGGFYEHIPTCHTQVESHNTPCPCILWTDFRNHGVFKAQLHINRMISLQITNNNGTDSTRSSGPHTE